MRYAKLAVTLLVLVHGSASAQTVSVFAGKTSIGGFCGDEGPASEACLSISVEDLAVDAAGNLFIADTANSRIRKVEAASGCITTYAGNGTRGFCGDDGPATKACLDHPRGIALDSSGNLYIVDSQNQRIRKVDAGSGKITTVAGRGDSGFCGDGDDPLNACLWNPVGVAVDSAGNLYIADRDNNRVRKVTAGSTPAITTVAGNGQNRFCGDNDSATEACLSLPSDAVIGASGDLFIADSANHRVRRVAASTGIITTYAGSETRGFCGDGGEADKACLDQPAFLSVNPAGDLLISDFGNSRIRLVEAANPHEIRTIVGKGSSGSCGLKGPPTEACLGEPRGVAQDSKGNLYIPTSPTVLRVSPPPQRCLELCDDWAIPPLLPTLALPTDGGVRSAEALCQIIPNVLKVRQGFPIDDPSGSGSYEWDCTAKTCVSSGPIPEDPQGCCSACFCLDDGEGFAVVTSGDGILELSGRDEAVSITLPPGGTQYWVSPPIKSTAQNVADLEVAMGVPTGTLFSDFDTCTGLIRSHVAGASSPFTLVPGRAVRVRFQNALTSAFTYTNPSAAAGPGGPSCFAQATVTGNEYCIMGISRALPYAWWIDIGDDGLQDTGEPRNPNAERVLPMGAGCQVLAEEFVASIAADSRTSSSNIKVTLSTSPCCFTLEVPGTYSLRVGPAGSALPDCKITSAGCFYNPLITLGPSPPTATIPALSLWGLLGFSLLLTVSAVLILRRRRPVAGKR